MDWVNVASFYLIPFMLLNFTLAFWKQHYPWVPIHTPSTEPLDIAQRHRGDWWAMVVTSYSPLLGEQLDQGDS